MKIQYFFIFLFCSITTLEVYSITQLKHLDYCDNAKIAMGQQKCPEGQSCVNAKCRRECSHLYDLDLSKVCVDGVWKWWGTGIVVE
jgi:hypothetical protein